MPSSRTRTRRRVAARRAEIEQTGEVLGGPPLIPPVLSVLGTKSKVYAAELNRLAQIYGTSNLDPKIVLDEASNPDSPLHDYFDWDDTSAARKHRLAQARQLVGTVKITYVGDPHPERSKRAIVTVITDVGERKYTGILSAMDSQEYKRQLIQREVNTIRGCRDRLRTYEELFAALPSLNDFLRQAEAAIPAAPPRRRRAR